MATPIYHFNQKLAKFAFKAVFTVLHGPWNCIMCIHCTYIHTYAHMYVFLTFLLVPCVVRCFFFFYLLMIIIVAWQCFLF